MPKLDTDVKNWLYDSSDDEDEEVADEAYQTLKQKLSKNWSSKLTAVIELVDRHFASKKNGKLVIVSQFCNFLSEIRLVLDLGWHNNGLVTAKMTGMHAMRTQRK